MCSHNRQQQSTATAVTQQSKGKKGKDSAAFVESNHPQTQAYISQEKTTKASIMHVGAFMVPADKVATCEPTDSVKYVLDTMLQRRIGAIVVLVPGKYKIPIGLITKSDLLMAYASRVPMNRPAKEIMTKDIDTVKESMSRDQAARVLTRNRNHHAIVVDENEHFKGIISTWDIVVECAKDDQAWPWNRSADGKFHKPDETKGSTESSAEQETTSSENTEPGLTGANMGDSFRAYVDNLGYFD
mmetsp:Transcript_27968/g.78360  ORF Transcript_27968/g.78360 Transcript_27968/m.78360 type:complete len:243 (-) Transcript_27968:250-978(-)